MHSNVYREKHKIQFSRLATDDEIDSMPMSVFRERLLQQRGSLKLSPTQVQTLCENADKNKDEVITVEEFSELISSKDAQKSQVARVLYTIADGFITPSQKVDVHSYIDEYTLCPPPIFILLITLIEIGVFLYYFFTLPDGSHADIWTYCAGCNHGGNYGVFLFVPKLREQAWRFTSYALLHSGLHHLLGNVIIQLLVGIPLEVVHKIWRIGPLYVLAVTSGALLQYSVDSSVLLAGASAGVYALITAHLANVFLNWSEMPFRWVRLAVLGVFLTYDVGGALYRRYYLNECDMISHAAHFAGGLTGVCFGVFVLYNIVDHVYEKIIRRICVTAYIIFFIGITALAIIRPPHSTPLIDSCVSN
ncbi:unnamed protein product [Auanema sp. JU1783]|nr:unnamed protein product [Auanema sp. JU1783]